MATTPKRGKAHDAIMLDFFSFLVASCTSSASLAPYKRGTTAGATVPQGLAGAAVGGGVVVTVVAAAGGVVVTVVGASVGPTVPQGLGASVGGGVVVTVVPTADGVVVTVVGASGGATVPQGLGGSATV